MPVIDSARQRWPRRNP